MSDDVLRMAWHEMGHALAARRAGCSDIAIRWKGTTSATCTCIEPPTITRRQRQVIGLAGLGAEVLFLNREASAADLVRLAEVKLNAVDGRHIDVVTEGLAAEVLELLRGRIDELAAAAGAEAARRLLPAPSARRRSQIDADPAGAIGPRTGGPGPAAPADH